MYSGKLVLECEHSTILLGTNIPLSRLIAFPNMSSAGLCPIEDTTSAFNIRCTNGKAIDHCIPCLVSNKKFLRCLRTSLFSLSTMPCSSEEYAMPMWWSVPINSSAALTVALSNCEPPSVHTWFGAPNIPMCWIIALTHALASVECVGYNITQRENVSIITKTYLLPSASSRSGPIASNWRFCIALYVARV